MKRIILFLLMFGAIFPLITSAQEQNKKYYIYNIFELRGGKTQSVYIDNGITVEELKDSKGNKIKFKTMAGTLMYLMSEGWELYMSQNKVEGGTYGGIGATSTTIRWIMRKPVSKEVLDNTMKNIFKE